MVFCGLNNPYYFSTELGVPPEAKLIQIKPSEVLFEGNPAKLLVIPGN